LFLNAAVASSAMKARCKGNDLNSAALSAASLGHVLASVPASDWPDKRLQMHLYVSLSLRLAVLQSQFRNSSCESYAEDLQLYSCSGRDSCEGRLLHPQDHLRCLDHR
jgi:hypothetical protein